MTDAGLEMKIVQAVASEMVGGSGSARLRDDMAGAAVRVLV